MKRLLLLSTLLPMLALAQTKKTVVKTVVKKTTTTTSSNPLAASKTRGKAVYMSTCLACHQVDGSGVPNMNPPLIKTSWVLGSKTVLVQQVLKGSQGKVEIEGETFHNVMPAQAQLTDQQIADVLTYVRNSFGNKTSMVTPGEVKAVRAKTN